MEEIKITSEQQYVYTLFFMLGTQQITSSSGKDERIVLKCSVLKLEDRNDAFVYLIVSVRHTRAVQAERQREEKVANINVRRCASLL